jgi:hypothetical protein
MLFLCFRNVTQNFAEASREPKRRQRGATGQPHHRELALWHLINRLVPENAEKYHEV